jgi:hypothetical protein
VRRFVRLPGGVGLEQGARGLDEPRILAREAEAAAAVHVELGVVEPEHVHFAVHDHHLAVMAGQVVGRPADGHARREKRHLQLAQPLLPAAVGVRDQRPHRDPAPHGRRERLLQLDTVEPEDHDVDALLRALYRHQQRRNAVIGLGDQFHGVLFGFGLLVGPHDAHVGTR